MACLVAERSSAGNDNKPGSPSAPCAHAAGPPAGQGCTEEGRGCWKPKRWHTRKRRVSCLSSVLGSCSPLSFFDAAVCYPLGGRWPVMKGRRRRRRRAGFSLLPESEGSAELWTAGALSVCLSPSKSIPPPITPPPPYASSLPPFRSLSPSPV